MKQKITMLEVNVNARKDCLSAYGRTEESLKQDVTTLRGWLQKQPHLPEVPDDEKIENFLMLNKGSIERTKEKIDMYYTIRSLIPEMYENVNPKLPRMQQIMDVIYWIPLPKQTINHYRVYCFKINDVDVDKFDPYAYFAHTLNVAEMRLHEDKVLGDVLIYDVAGCKMGHIAKITPTAIMKINAVLEKVYSSRLKGIYYINVPPFIDNLISMIKTIVKPKIAQRIHVYKDSAALNEHFPKEMLPKDYGGDEKSLQELNEMLKAKLQEYQERFDLLDKLRVDETLRPEKLKNDEVLGFHGNFKKLNVD